MPPPLALGLALVLIVVLLIRETRQQQGVSAAVWIPFLWLSILGSRSVSQWLNLQAPYTPDALTEGSPTDRIVYLLLIISAFLVVRSRKVKWGELFSGNGMLVVFFAYCAISIAWSDYPFVSFKRWFKSFGDPLMALVLLSEANPSAAVISVLRRCAYVLLPLSVVFIKYYPTLGRAYSDWGPAYYTGVTTNKNLLGYLLLVFGLLFVCTMLTRAVPTDSQAGSRRSELVVGGLLLVMIAWLFRTADSKTPLIALLVASATVVALGWGTVRRHFGTLLIIALCVGGVLQLLFNLTGGVLASAGRDETLTGRTELWDSVLAMAVNSWVGAGYESFWLGERLWALWEQYEFRPTQAHNGYIEVYLNLGWLGLLCLAGILGTAYRTTRGRLVQAFAARRGRTEDLVMAKFGMAFFLAYILYNITEATFQSLNFLFVIFMILILRYERGQSAATPDRVGPRTPRGLRRGQGLAAQSTVASGAVRVRSTHRMKIRAD